MRKRCVRAGQAVAVEQERANNARPQAARWIARRARLPLGGRAEVGEFARPGSVLGTAHVSVPSPRHEPGPARLAMRTVSRRGPVPELLTWPSRPGSRPGRAAART